MKHTEINAKDLHSGRRCIYFTLEDMARLVHLTIQQVHKKRAHN